MAKNLNISVLLDFYGDMLTEKQREVVEFYYNEDLSLAEIAEHSGITRQGVRDSIKRAENQLLEYESKLGLWARFLEIKQGMDEISRMARDIQSDFASSPFSSNLRDRLQSIIDIAQNLND